MNGHPTHAKFETTHWPLVDELRAPDSGRRAGALATLVERYWPAVYASLRRMGYCPDEAAEVTQGFFADVVIGRGLFEHASGQRGRLRTLVLTSLRRYIVDLRRRAIVRGAGRIVAMDGLEREEAIIAGAAALEPDEAFERRWALALLDEALRRCEAHFVASGRGAHWTLFEARVIRPSVAATTRPALAELAPAYGFRTPADAAAAVQVVKKRLLAVLREVIAETASDTHDQEEELRLVLSL